MHELLRDALREITANPPRFLAEFMQSALLIAGLWWFGRRYAAKRLSARAARIASQLDAADLAERDSVRIREEARQLVEQAKRDAPDIIRVATEQVASERDAAAAQIEMEARELVEQAGKSVEAEKARVRRESADRLVRLTTEAARRYLDDMLSESERRALTQQAIVRFLEDLEHARDPEHAGAG